MLRARSNFLLATTCCDVLKVPREAQRGQPKGTGWPEGEWRSSNYVSVLLPLESVSFPPCSEAGADLVSNFINMKGTKNLEAQLCSSCGESRHCLPAYTQAGAGSGSLPPGSPSPPMREIGRKAGLPAGALEAGTDRMQLQHPPLQDPRTCGASGQKGTEAREPPGPDLLPGSRDRTWTDLIQVLQRVLRRVDRGHAHPAGLSGNAIPGRSERAREQSRGAEPGQEEATLAGQTWPWTTSLGGKGDRAPRRAALARKLELPGQRGPHSVLTQPSAGSPPGRQQHSHPAISRVPARPSAGSLPGCQQGPRPAIRGGPARPSAGQAGPGRPGALGQKGTPGRSPLVGEAAAKAPTSVLRTVCPLTQGAKRIPREAPPGFGADSRASGSRGAEQRACGDPRRPLWVSQAERLAGVSDSWIPWAGARPHWRGVVGATGS